MKHLLLSPFLLGFLFIVFTDLSKAESTNKDLDSVFSEGSLLRKEKYSDHLYLGQIRKLKSTLASKEEYTCPEGKTPQSSNICYAGKGEDKLGKPMLRGWLMFDPPGTNWVFYTDPEMYKVKVNGEYGRYINLVEVSHAYIKPEAGTTGYSYSSGKSKTSCIDFRTIHSSYNFYILNNFSSPSSYGTGSSRSTIGGPVNCVTTPAEIINVPGKGSTEGYVRVDRLDWIVDCKTSKVAGFNDLKKQNVYQKWLPIKDSESSAIKQFAPKFCPIINQLTPSMFNAFSFSGISK